MSIDSVNENSSSSSTTNERDSVVDAVFDTTLGWIDVGLGRARTTLSNGARALIRTAKALDVVRERLRA
ncbi:MAG TPA: hypothetical protein VM925_13310 [Labilithrix sp.]|nr:hypothetical protein [Labilithrix sp.]